MAIKTTRGALAAARKLIGRKATVSHYPARDIPEKKLKNGRIRKARHIEQSFSIGEIDQCIPGFPLNWILGESKGEGASWDDALAKAKAAKEAERKRAAERKKRNAARS